MKRWMKQAVFFMIAAVAVSSFTGCGATKVEVPKNLTGSVYTQFNMWEEKGHINAINYSVGRKIPANTEVKIISMSSNNIVFEDIRFPDVKLSLDNSEKHTQMNTVQLAAQYFGSSKVNVSKFTKAEQAFIIDFAGFYTKGISKEAMIVARGYPPKHETPSLKYDQWRYWRNRWVSNYLNFKDNKAVAFKGQQLQ
ncbi:MAG: hypothetical protein DRG24_00215 [Epsilonproteobacteria bacterium]|nr:MAG: hypothetical protein DRG24_00215 [Campylobacterota bacterium]